MARNTVRDERQGDLLGTLRHLTNRSAGPPRRGRCVRRHRRQSQCRWASSARRQLDELLDGMPDQELAYLAVEATRLVKRRLVRGQGRGLRPKGAGKGESPLDDALARIGGELMEFEDPGETW